MTAASLEPTSSKDNSQSVSPRKESSLSEAAKNSKYTDKNVQELTKAFEDGATITEACHIAQIARSTYYNWVEQYPEFMDKMSEAQEYPDAVAKMVVVRAMKKSDVETSKWWLERRIKKEFSAKSELEHSGTISYKPIMNGSADVIPKNKSLRETANSN